ncbi:ferritin-like domain-containing protein [Propionibacterium australiense]|uniref:Bacterioferritin n=1 Tax=Propionibacterium australiense TaxID=119981 RepID=A0A383S6J8_9ACTN|nr:ferritin-like domain-containing protein [Propionibacterium australiense]RLP08527.1 bacterioferritin [Propionibacterium australiense]RLP08596.1 bacterioferritin [Propionibacterium australiense]SYZ33620.1 Ferritin-related [Propionibacterium australiense]VEH88813.1 Bacterioferritin [Propionibacterium australiense]
MTEQNTNEIIATLNELLGVYWAASAQHQAHVKLLSSWGLVGLSADMKARTEDEPETISELSDRLLDLGGRPDIVFPEVHIGTTLREVLDNDMELQRNASEALNEIAERMGRAHDATTRRLIEQILSDEEQHLYWLQSEIELLEKLGEQLYTAARLNPAAN